jgi:KUP system potassium uptake protein
MQEGRLIIDWIYYSWIFTIVVIFKYALIVLQFGTGMGEGGTFALYQALFPKAMSDDIRDDTTYGVAAATHSIGGLAGASINGDRREKLLKYSWIKPVLCAWALFGSGLTVSFSAFLRKKCFLCLTSSILHLADR